MRRKRHHQRQESTSVVANYSSLRAFTTQISLFMSLVKHRLSVMNDPYNEIVDQTQWRNKQRTANNRFKDV